MPKGSGEYFNIGAVCAWIAWQVVGGGYYVSNERPERFGYRDSPASYPIRTTDWIEAASGVVTVKLEENVSC